MKQQSVTVREETVVIPTYRACEPEKSPLFIEKRAYQGQHGEGLPPAGDGEGLRRKGGCGI